MARAIWEGGINFGLIHIPVNLFSAEQSQGISFTMLDKKDHSRIRFKRVNESSGKEVEWSQITKGYEYEPDHYVIMNDEDFEEARVKTSPNVEIQEFIEEGLVAPKYFEKPYFLLPRKGGEKAYVLLREALKDTGMWAVATVVIRSKEYLAALIPSEDLLVLNTLRFQHELRSKEDLNFEPRSAKELNIKPAELNMAVKLVKEMQSDKWDATKYKDVYNEKLEEIIQEKIESGGKRKVAAVSKKVPPTSKVIDLAALLKESIKVAPKRRASGSPKKKGGGKSGRKSAA